MDVLYSALGYESASAPAPTLGCDEDDEAPAPTARRVYDDERNALVAPQRRGESNDTVRGAASSSAPMSAAASAAAAICAAASAAARRRAATSSFATPKAVPSFTPTPVGSPDDVVDDDRAEARPRRHMLELQRDGVLEHESAASSCVRRQPLFLILASRTVCVCVCVRARVRVCACGLLFDRKRARERERERERAPLPPFASSTKRDVDRVGCFEKASSPRASARLSGCGLVRCAFAKN